MAGLVYTLWRKRARARLLAKAVTIALQSRDEHARRMAMIANRTGNALAVTGADGCIEWVNAGFTRMTGYAAADAMGKRLADFLLHVGSDHTAADQLCVKLLGGEAFNLELDAKTKSGASYWVALEIQPTGDEGGGCVAVATDITRRVRAEQELRRAHGESEARVVDRTKALSTANQALQAEIAERMRVEAALRLSERKSRSILETALDAVITADADGAITAWNRQAECTFGWTAEEAVGQPIHELMIPHHYREAHMRGIRRARETGEGSVLNRRVEVVALHKDGHEFPVELSIAPLPVDETYVFSAFARDITDRKRAQEELSQAKAAAEAANAAKSAFLANMSHEIRTPMAAIIGHADLLLDPDRSQSDRLDSVDAIRRSGEHLLAVINDILDLSKIEAGKMTVERVDCDPCRVVGEVASLMRPRAQEKRLEFHVRFDTPLPRSVRNDPTRLRQVLINLVGNAIKFTKSGSVRLVLRLDDAPGHQPVLRFEVQDTGVGMTAEQVSRVFRPFAQADDSTTRQFGGTGLGLTICRRLARLMGGEIEVQTEEGRGSRFTLVLPTGPLDGTAMITDPAEAARAGDFAAARGAADAAPAVALRGRVLLAEDGPENQVVVASYLRKAGAEVAIANDGREAVEMARSEAEAGRPFDVILMDMQMPHLDGYGAASNLRGLGLTIPIVALTAHAMSEDRDKCLNAGCTDYLSKPVNRAELLATMHRHLSGHGVVSPPAEAGAGAVAGAGPAAGAGAGASPTLRSTVHDDPVVQQYLPEFLGRLPLQVAAMEHLLAECDLAAVAEHAHQLKGSGGLYGFPQITQAAAEAEKRVNEQQPLEAVRAAVVELVRLVRSVERYDPAKESSPADGADRNGPA